MKTRQIRGQEDGDGGRHRQRNLTAGRIEDEDEDESDDEDESLLTSAPTAPGEMALRQGAREYLIKPRESFENQKAESTVYSLERRGQASRSMNPALKKADRVIWLGIGLTIALLLLATLLAALRMRASLGKPLPMLGHVADFALTNQLGQPVSLAGLHGHVWVADLIFTRCAGPCPKMTRQMKELQDALQATSRAKLVTLTTDPDYDTPAVLKRYAEKFGADPGRWWFLTGSKKQIFDLAVGSLKLTAVEKPEGERASPVDLFVHSTIFVVVDQRGQLRGIFETTGEGVEPQQVRGQLLAAVRRLETERL